MTNYNEKLDKIAIDLWVKYGRPGAMDDFVRESKQVLTSLIKELVAESKPGTWVDPEYTDDLEWQGYVKGVEHFEHNLLKALEAEL